MNWIKALIYNQLPATSNLLLLFILLLLSSCQEEKNPNTIYETDFAEEKTFKFPDESSVMLNAKSSLAFNHVKWDTEHFAVLMGEGLFNIKNGPKFKVISTDAAIITTGGKFNAKARENLLLIDCINGKLDILNKGGYKYTLNAGEGIRLENGVAPRRYAVTADPAWISGKIKFDNELLVEVCQELERQYRIKISHPLFGGKRFTGTLPNDNLDEALKIVFENGDIKYTKDVEGNVRIEF